MLHIYFVWYLVLSILFIVWLWCIFWHDVCCLSILFMSYYNYYNIATGKKKNINHIKSINSRDRLHDFFPCYRRPNILVSMYILFANCVSFILCIYILFFYWIIILLCLCLLWFLLCVCFFCFFFCFCDDGLKLYWQINFVLNYISS